MVSVDDEVLSFIDLMCRKGMDIRFEVWILVLLIFYYLNVGNLLYFLGCVFFFNRRIRICIILVRCLFRVKCMFFF